MLLGLVACAPARLQKLQEDVDHLEVRVEQRRAEVAMLRATVDRATRPWKLSPPTHLPKGYTPDAPLPAPSERPDILLVSIDTLRADHLGCYGYERPTSPFIDALAREGTRYSDFWSPAPWTLPSHTTMLSGLLPDRHGAIEDEVRIGPGIPLLQQTLSESGYRTAGVVSTLFVSRKFGFERGFDYFQDFGITNPKANNSGVVDAEEVFSNALHWAQQQPDGSPLFTFVHLYDVHYTYNAPEPFNTRFDRPAKPGDAVYKNYRSYKKRMIDDEQLAHQIAQYDEEIAYVDDQLRQYVERWRASGRQLIVMVTADHGEEFGERGSWGHAHTLYPEQLHVPLVVSGPGIRAQVVSERSGTEDIAPTLAALGGTQHPQDEGRDRRAQLASGGLLGTSGRYAETSRFETLQMRIHHRGRDLIVDVRKGAFEVCDLGTDPRCEGDLTPDPDTLKELLSVLTARLGAPWTATAAGDLRTSDGGVLWFDGPTARSAKVEAGTRFSVVPPDGSVRLRTATRDWGPFSALKGPMPAPESELTYAGPTWGNIGVELTDEEQQMLRELGYIQD